MVFTFIPCQPFVSPVHHEFYYIEHFIRIQGILYKSWSQCRGEKVTRKAYAATHQEILMNQFKTGRLDKRTFTPIVDIILSSCDKSTIEFMAQVESPLEENITKKFQLIWIHITAPKKGILLTYL